MTTPELFAELASNRRQSGWTEVVERRLDASVSIEAVYSEGSTAPAELITVVAVVRTHSTAGSTFRREVVILRVVATGGTWLVAGIE